MAETILISRTDSIGDVILTLPICAWLKQQYPKCTILFLGQAYTQPVIECYSQVDRVIVWNNIAKLSQNEQLDYFNHLAIDICIHVFPKKPIAQLIKKCKIPTRIGTSHRLFHLTTCNVRPNFTRKNSDLHEAQLNFELLRSIGLKKLPTLDEIQKMYTYFKPKTFDSPKIKSLLQLGNKKIILHPKSQGSAVEWPIEHYIQLAKELTKLGYIVFFTGTEKEGVLFKNLLPQCNNIYDLTGTFSLSEFIYFISQCHGLVACSTGPLHIASILDILAIGLFSEMHPIHPGRWKPIGAKSKIITAQKTKNPPRREDIQKISVAKVKENIIHT